MPTRRKHWIPWLLLAQIALGAIGFVVLLTVPAPIERWLQDRVLLALREHYRSDVQLQSLRVMLVPFDPIFMKHGAGTYLPVSVAGTREHPQIKLNWKRIF
jgi:hypothetical protein